MSDLAEALRLAANAHHGQVDRHGQPYILHPLRMMFRVETEAERMVALLHDVVENTSVRLDDLRRAGFSAEIVEAVALLTRDANEPYEKHIEKLAGNALARKVKLADLEDNMDLKRIRQLTDNDLARLQRYHRAWQALSTR